MKNYSICCDFCKNDLTYSYHQDGYFLTLKNTLKMRESVDSNGLRMEYAIMVSPILKEDLHFCGFDCLKKYLNA